MKLFDVSRRDFVVGGLKNAGKLALASAASAAFPQIGRAGKRPNILFIAIDDLNDWVQPLGGYKGVRTPYMQRLADRSRVYFNANAPAPACSPARAAIMFGVQPWRSGVYTNNENWEVGSRLVGQTSLVRFFKENGYATIGAGKIFHQGWGAGLNPAAAGNDPDAWTDFQSCGSADDGCQIPSNAEEEDNDDAVIDLGDKLRFGPSTLDTSRTSDVVRARWFARNVLGKRHDKPLFAAIGLQKPHLPFTPPKEFFDLYDKSRLHYPPGVLDPANHTAETNRDVADLPPAGVRMLKQHGLQDHARIINAGAWEEIVHAYLASISYVDHCLGIVLNAWLEGPNASDTIVVLWSDHGWQLGEKLGWRKFTLWERATRVPFFIGGSFGGRTIERGLTAKPVSTINLFPTLADLAFGRRPNAAELGGLALDGESLKGDLLGGTAPSTPVLTSWALKLKSTDESASLERHFSVRTQGYRLIQYGDGDRELYDHGNDPYEFRNLLAAPTNQTEAVAAKLAAAIPAPSECVPRANSDAA